MGARCGMRTGPTGCACAALDRILWCRAGGGRDRYTRFTGVARWPQEMFYDGETFVAGPHQQMFCPRRQHHAPATSRSSAERRTPAAPRGGPLVSPADEARPPPSREGKRAGSRGQPRAEATRSVHWRRTRSTRKRRRRRRSNVHRKARRVEYLSDVRGERSPPLPYSWAKNGTMCM